MIKSIGAALLVTLIASVATATEDPTLLVRVPRATESDLETLRSWGAPVVMELRPCLFVRGRTADLAALRARGLQPELIDDRAAISDYFIVGLRPDSDEDAVRAFGAVLLEEENWVLVRVERGKDPATLREARVFASLVPDEPVQAPKPPPAARESRALTLGVPDPIVETIVATVSNASIDDFWQDLTSNPPSGTRYSTAQGCRDAASYCLDAYASMGVSATYQEWSPTHAPNVVATIEGAVRPDDVYIVVGHLDDLPSTPPAPGADDNASGSVNVLESARVMACWGFKGTVKFLNATGEEFGLYGSDAYADDAFARGENIRGVINMDMIGWAGNGIPAQENLDLDYNGPSQWLAQRFADAATTYGTGLAVNSIYCPSLTASDHAPFWQKGWSAVCGITDNEGYCGQAGNYPYYHTSNDTIANCGAPSFFYSVVRTSVATLSELAEPFKVTFDRTAYSCGGILGVVVADRDHNTNPTTAQSFAVRVWSDTEPAGETVTVTERGLDSMLFDGTIPTTLSPPATGDGAVSMTAGDTLYAEYVDALDCDGSTDVAYIAQAGTDCAAPSISSVQHAGVTDVAATISWTTDEPSDSVVAWGPTKPPSATTSKGDLVETHQVTLSGLQPCTVYYYEVRSSDAAGNTASNDDGGQYFHFETLGNFGSGLQPCHEGRVSLDRSVVSCADALPVRLVDMDLNASALTEDTAIVTVSSSTETAPETLLLLETGPNTSTFVGSIATSIGTPSGNDAVLQVGHGDLVTAAYEDDDDGTGNGGISFATGDVDCSGPTLSDIRVTDVTDESAIVRWTTDEPATSRVEWGTTPALGNVASSDNLVTSHALTLLPMAECGRIHFRVVSTDARGNTRSADVAGTPFAMSSWRIPGIFRESFEGSTGWTLEGEFQIAPPEGNGSSLPDPVAAFEGSRILGHDVTGLGAYPGDYEPQTTQRAISPVIDASSLVGGKLKFRRWLNVGGGAVSYVDVKRGAGWYSVYSSNAALGNSETAWSLQTIDISALADGNAQLQIAFRQNGGLSASAHRSGWNVDRVIVKGSDTPDFDACGGCSGPPTFSGALAAEDVSACADSGIAVTWDPATAWGTGHAGSYAVYRDASPTFTPAPSNRIAAGLSGTTYTDLAAPNGVTLHYVVRAENDETCSTGPANGGVTDANLIRMTAVDSVSQPAPDDVGSSVRADEVNLAHVRLAWDPTAGAWRYRIYRADTPAGPFFVRGEVEDTSWEDRDEMGSSSNRYYRVRAVDACGNEGP